MKKLLNIVLCWMMMSSPALAVGPHTDHFDYYTDLRVKGTTYTSTVTVEGTGGEGFVEFPHQSADAGTPGTGSSAVRLMAKSKKMYQVTDDGAGNPVVSGLGGTGAGEINYVTESNFEDGSVTGWVSYADAAGVVPVDATGGSPNVTFAVNSTTPLNGLVDAKFAKDAANRQGEGVAYAFKLPPAYRSQMNKLSITYRTTANYDVATEGVSAFIYNVDTGVVIYPNGFNATTSPRLPHNLNGGTIVFGWLPTNTTDDDYRLVLHAGLTGTAAWDLYVDEIVTGPGSVTQGFPGSIPAAFTPAAAVTNATFNSAKYWRDGKMFNADIAYTFTGASSLVVAWNQLLPTGLTADVANIVKVTADGYADAVIGSFIAADASTQVYQGPLRLYTDGTIKPIGATGNSSLMTPGNTDGVVYHLRDVPIVEWSSPVYLAGANINSPAKAGFIQAYAGATAPAGWMLADGSAISRTTYAQLFANIGTTWGVGDNSTTFNLPDLRGIFQKGAGATASNTTIRTDALGKDAAGNYYTGGNVGATSYKTDMFQGHYHKWVRVSVGLQSGAVVAGDTANQASSAGGTDEGKVFAPTTGANGGVRAGATTEPQSASVTYIIKLYDDLQAPSVGFAVAKAGAAGLLSYYQEDDTSLAANKFKGNLGGSDSGVCAVTITRVGRVVTLTMPGIVTVVPTTSSAYLVSTVALPTWARPTATAKQYIAVWNNNTVDSDTLGVLSVETSGLIRIYRDQAGTTYTNSQNAGFDATSISYVTVP